MSEEKKQRAENGSVPRYGAPEYRTSYQKMRSELERLTKERDGWMESAAQHCRNEDFYRGLVQGIGAQFGDPAYISDDGSRQQDVLCLKVPELVREKLSDLSRLTKERDALAEQLADITETHRTIMDENCQRPDEKHCTCVPGLRAGIKTLQSREKDICEKWMADKKSLVALTTENAGLRKLAQLAFDDLSECAIVQQTLPEKKRVTHDNTIGFLREALAHPGAARKEEK